MNSVRLLVVLSLLAAATTPGIATTNESTDLATANESTDLATTNEPSNVATTNEPPLADAGLDQTVTRGTTVYLDAGESRDPDGSIVDYRWTITHESENDTTATPECRDCEQTRFQPEATGMYRVTLEVTDDDQVTSTDSLFVEVETGEPPSVTLSSASQTSIGDATRVTADVTGGAAPLRELIWRVDGERVDTESLSGNANTTTHVARFPTTGAHSVSVVVTDEDDLQDSATREITVVDSTQFDTETGQDSSGESGDDRPIADVTGPRVVTGHGALDADYELAGDATGTWMVDGKRVATGSTASVSLSPGVHEIYAATDRGVATFPDGNRNVVADPAPELEVGNLSDASVVPVDIHATDEFGNLQSVTISVDGETVEMLTVDQVGGQRTGQSLSTVEYLDSLAPGSHAIAVRARDARGQTTVEIRTVEVPGPPEVVSAGFVEDEPLDQYHPRLNESRYTGTYRVKVDLNGVDPSMVSAKMSMRDSHWASNMSRQISKGEQTVLFEMAGVEDELRPLFATSSIFWRSDDLISTQSDEIPVTSAPPEIRVTPFDYQVSRESGKGIGLDASDSFDPDGRELEYIWKAVENDDVRNPRVHLESFDYTSLVVRDKRNEKSSSRDLLGWFVPDLHSVEYEVDEPIYPNETVNFTVYTEQYFLTKNTYENLTRFELRTEYGDVTSAEQLDESPFGRTRTDSVYPPYWYKWTVEVPGRAFLDGSSNVTTYSTRHPAVEHSMELPDVKTYQPTTVSLEELTVDTEYLVERADTTTRHTANEDVRDSLLDEGYAVVGSSSAGHEYELEEYVKTQDAVYDTDRLEFDSDAHRQYYLELNDDWEGAGTTTETNTWTATEKVWRSSTHGEGTFTGETRRKLVEEGEYYTEKQYEYEATETYQTTVTYQDTYTTTETEIDYEERCTAFGCFKYRTTSTETVTRTVTRTKTVTRTRSVTEQYWSTRPRDATHRHTGDTRQVTVSEPEYERQYQYEVERQYSKTNRLYLAEQRTLIQPATYSWEVTSTVSSEMQAESAAMATDVRIGDIVPTTEWTLRKQHGTETDVVHHLKEGWKVLETRAEAEGTLVQQYIEEDGKQLPEYRTRNLTVSENHTADGFVSDEEIKDIIVRNIEERNDE